MFRHKFDQTGLPYVLLAIFFIAVMIYIEMTLSSQNDDTHIVIISSDSDDSFEDASITQIGLATTNTKISKILQELIIDDKTMSTLQKNPHVNSLSATEKSYLYSGLAQKFYLKHDYINVVEALEQFDAADRLTHKVQFLYAYCLSKLSKRKLAIEQYQLLIDYEPHSQVANLNLGLLLKKLERYDEAIPVFIAAASISSGRNKAKALSGLASCHYQLGQYSDAVSQYRKSIEYQPNAAHVWIMLANAIAATDSTYQEALDAFTKGIALNAQDYKSYLYKAKFQLAHYDYSGAVFTLQKALSLSNNVEAHELMAWAYIEHGQRVNAKKHIVYLSKHATSKKQKKRADLLLLYANKNYQKVISELKRHKQLSDNLIYLKGLTYRRLYYYTNASSIFDQLTGSQEFSWRAQIQQTRIARSRKQYDKAIVQYEALLNHNDTAAFLWFEAALTHEKNVQPEDGIIKISNAIRLSPNNNVYKLTHVRLLRASKQIKLALAVLDEVLNNKPKYVRALRLQAEILANNTENNDELIATYKRLVAIDSTDYDTLLKLSKNLLRTGEHKNAQAYLVMILDEQSGNIEARYLLAMSYYNANQLIDSLNEIENLLRLDKNNQQAIMLKETITSRI